MTTVKDNIEDFVFWNCECVADDAKAIAQKLKAATPEQRPKILRRYQLILQKALLEVEQSLA